LSGKLAGDGCRYALVTGGDGVRRESLEYTEYFVHGTEPTEYCPIHGARDLMTLVTGWFRGQPATLHPSTPDLVIRPSTAAVVPPTPAPAGPPTAATVRPSTPATISPTPAPDPDRPDEPEEPRRGFWGRVFRR
jgi:hypothetical protein